MWLQAEKAKTAGGGWFDMRASEMTEEKKNDLLILKMRKTLDPKQFYKGADMKGLPKFFQVNQILNAPCRHAHISS